MKLVRFKILLLVSFIVLSLVSVGYVGCAKKGAVGNATLTPTLTLTTPPTTTVTPAYASPCWGVLDWGDYPYHQGGIGWVFCWEGYGINFWDACWDAPHGRCWDGNDVFCRDDGGEGWRDCYDYYYYGKTWESTAVVN